MDQLLAYVIQRAYDLAIELDDTDAREAVILYRRLENRCAGATELDDWLRAHCIEITPEPPGIMSAASEIPEDTTAWFDALAGGRRHDAVD